MCLITWENTLEWKNKSKLNIKNVIVAVTHVLDKLLVFNLVAKKFEAIEHRYFNKLVYLKKNISYINIAGNSKYSVFFLFFENINGISLCRFVQQ